MAINFPNSLDTFENPTPTTKRNELSLAGLCSDLNDAVEALEAKVGVDNSTVQTSLDYLLKNSNSVNPGHKHTLSDGATDITASVDHLNSINQALGTGDSPTFNGLTLSTPLEVSSGGTGLSSVAADNIIYTSADNTFSATPITSFGRSLIDDADAATARNTLGLGSIATQNADNVNITGGSISGITPLAIADGGTGASTAADARSNLGVAGLNDANVFGANQTLNKTGTATDTTQYSSYDLILKGSGWDTNAGAEAERTISLRAIAGSGDPVPYRLGILDNGGTEFVTFDGVNQRVGIGITNPGYNLEIKGGGAEFAVSNTDDTNRAAFFLRKSNGDRAGFFYYDVNSTSFPGDLKFHLDNGNFIFGGSNNPNVIFSSEVNNVGIGTDTFGTNAAKVLAIANGTAPTSSPADMVQLYAEDVSGSSELKVRDEAGNVTVLSPHDPETGEWIFYSVNTKTGKVLRVDMEKLVKFIDEKFGTNFVKEYFEK